MPGRRRNGEGDPGRSSAKELLPAGGACRSFFFTSQWRRFVGNVVADGPCSFVPDATSQADAACIADKVEVRFRPCSDFRQGERTVCNGCFKQLWIYVSTRQPDPVDCFAELVWLVQANVRARHSRCGHCVAGHFERWQ